MSRQDYDEFRRFGETRPAFATAREIVSHSIPADLNLRQDEDGNMFSMGPNSTDTPEAVMERKYKTAKDRGIAEDVRKRGIIHPIRMISDGAHPSNLVKDGKVPLLYNGQHRVAVMLHENPDAPIPIEWDKHETEWRDPKKNTKYNQVFPPKARPKKTK